MIFHGRVQGVGFRATTSNIAATYPVCGFVRNLADGTVDLEIQGTPDAIDKVLAEIARTFPGYITRREESVIASIGGERGLNIAR